MNAHPADGRPANLGFEMLAVPVATFYLETDIPMFRGIEMATGKSSGRAGVNTFTAVAAPALHRLTRFQQGIG